MPDIGDKGRDAPTNFITICNTIADSYPQSIAHGLQKDAIQNSLDAKKNTRVDVKFEVIKNDKGNFLTFTDSNTSGLTGNVVSNRDDYKNLTSDDHWARFEGFGYTKDDPDALGARGQGKFIFLRASERYMMFYDTLREDGVYRLGATQATDTARFIFPKKGKWEGGTASKQLNKDCGLQPLQQVGTRIIVCDPRDEVLEEINNGAFERAIQETWFRVIEKKQLQVWLSTSGNYAPIELPAIYPLPTQDSGENKTWIYGQDFDNPTIISSDGEFKIKKFHAVYLPDKEIPEGFQGITIVQNGMKITTRSMGGATPSNIREKVTGYIEFDIKLDRELRKDKNQHPNHYDLKWRRATPQAIRNFIDEQLRNFGHEKLRIGEDPRKKRNRDRINAEQKAMELLTRYASDIDLRGGNGPGPSPNSPPHPPQHKKIGLTTQTQFPDSNKQPRVDWGEILFLTVHCFNRTDRDRNGMVAVRVLRGDDTIETLVKGEKILLRHANGDKPYELTLNSGKPLEININESRYENPGEYRIRLTLIDVNTGEEIDARTVKFWIEENPPQRMPFNLESTPMEEHRKIAWEPEGRIGSNPTIYYNTNHPQYKFVQDEEEQHADYLFNIALEGALHFILTRSHTDQGADYHPLNTEEIVGSSEDEMPEKVYQQISEFIAEVRWRRFHEE